MRCAAHSPANDYADAILVICDGDGPTNELQDHSIRYLVHQAELETGRMQFVVGHQELDGAATRCPGPLIMEKVRNGTYYPRPDPIGPPTEPQTQEDEVSKLIKIKDSGQQIDLAVMAVTGTFVEWIATQQRYELLLFLQSLETPPRPVQEVERSFLQYLTLIGQPPIYPATYTGPKTSPADFARWVS
jgi:hypothetical protein